MSTKLIANFDYTGKILSMISTEYAPSGVRVGMVAPAGAQTVELDAVALDLTDVTADKLRAIAHAYTVSDPIMTRALIKKP